MRTLSGKNNLELFCIRELPDHGPIFSCGLFLPYDSSESILLSAPVRLDLELTTECRQSCLHCYMPNERPISMDVAMAKQIVHEAASMGVIGIQFIGGEPFLHENIVELLHLTKVLGMKVEVFTGAYGAKREDVMQTREYFDRVAVSLDGIGPCHDEFRGTEGSFELVIKLPEMSQRKDCAEPGNMQRKKRTPNIPTKLALIKIDAVASADFTISIPYNGRKLLKHVVIVGAGISWRSRLLF